MLENTPNNITEPLLLHGDCAELLQRIPDNSVDAIITDPPYLYLDNKKKNSAFDKPFDCDKIFHEWKRILKDTGFLLFFGRGSAFYRWNVMIEELGLIFKEEIIWYKTQLSSPFLKLGRKHETIALYGKTKKACVRGNRVPYKEELGNMSIEEAIADIKKKIKSLNQQIKREDVLKDIITYLDTGIQNYRLPMKQNNNVTIGSNSKKQAFKTVGMWKYVKEGIKESDVINIIPDVIKVASNSVLYHPTQKPTRLIERLINIVTDEGALVLDSFMGSGTTGIASLNTNRRFIGMELDENYFDIAKNRIAEHKKQIIPLLLQ